MNQVFARSPSLKDVQTHFCPGCHHGSIHRLVAEALDEFSLREKTIGCASVGCSVFLYGYFNIDVVESPHGRAPAVATGVKRARPDSIVFTYQGDGDLAAIGTSEIIHAANRGEDITVIFVNNTTYGMTGGQMAPTTLVGMKTTTTPLGRNARTEGPPIKVCELLQGLANTVYLERTAVNSPANVIKTKKAIKKAFHYQQKQAGFSLVEILSPCPTNWRMDAPASCTWIDEVMAKEFPLGVIKEVPC